MTLLESKSAIKLGILLRWLSANDAVTYTANLKWFDWIITNFKPGDTIATTRAINKLGEYEEELNKLSPKKQKRRTKAGRRKLVDLPLFVKEGTSRKKTLRMLDSFKDEKTGIKLTFEDMKQIIDSIILSTVPTVSTSDIIDSYAQAGKWLEGISPEVSCFYDYTNDMTKRGKVGAVTVADTLSLLVEPYAYGFGYSIENESIVNDLYKKLVSFKQDDEFGTGFLPGGDVPLCQVPIVESTAIASIALCNYHSYLEEINKTDQLDGVKNEIATTVEWLMNTQFEKGYWSTHKSKSYKPYPDVQATQVAIVALSISPLADTLTEQCIKNSISYIKAHQNSDGGWGTNFYKKESNSVATARILWALITLSEKYDVEDLIETAAQSLKSNIKVTEKYHVEEIYIPADDTRSLSSTKWRIPVKPFIISTLLRYYICFKAGIMDENMQKYINDGILEILSPQQKFGGWLGTEDGATEYPSPSSTYYHARTLILKAMQDYTYLKQALKVK